MSDMNIKKVIESLRSFPNDISVSATVISRGQSQEKEITSYKGLVIINTRNQNTPAIFASNSTFIPSTNVSTLIRMFSINPNFDNSPVILLPESDGFFLTINDDNPNNLYVKLSGENINEDGSIKSEVLNKYEFMNILDFGTFLTLMFELRGMEQ